MYSSQRNTLVRVELLAKRNDGTADESLRKEGMSECISVVRQHQYFLELASRTNCELEDILLRFEDDAIEVIDSIADSNC